MTDKEVNKIVSEFMGAVFYESHNPTPMLILNGAEIHIEGFNKYTKSLDALVPVWEKLEFLQIRVDWFSDNEYAFCFLTKHKVSEKRETIQQAPMNKHRFS